MPAPLEIVDDGFIEVKIGDVKAEIDAYEYHNKLLEIDAKLADELPEAGAAERAVAFNTRVAALLHEKFGTVSHRAADKFALALYAAVERLGKGEAAAPTPG